MSKYKGRGDMPPVWEEAFLRDFRENGGDRACARRLSIAYAVVKKHLADSPRFAALYEEAHAEFVEKLEHLLLQMAKGEIKSTGFLAVIARLKAERPHKYNEKLQITGAVAHVHAAPPAAEIQALLRSMLGDATPETRKAITDGTIIEIDEDVRPDPEK